MLARFDALLVRLAGPEGGRILVDHRGWLSRLRVGARVARRFILLFVFVALASAVVVTASGMDIYHRTELPRFCALCHEMTQNFASWEVSLHKSVKCVECHARPGFTGWMRAKLNGTRQLLKHITAKSIEDIQAPAEHGALISSNCQRCHPGAVRLDERQGIAISHKRHLEIGVECVRCHTRAFAHPDPAGAATGKGPRPALSAARANCLKCHDGKNRVGAVTAFKAEDEANCARCHKDAELANRHGGASRTCTDCHEARKDAHFTMPAKTGEICNVCHESKETHATSHKAFVEGRCQDCHRVMAPAYLYLTGSAPSAGACLTCHEEMAARLVGDARLKPGRFRNGDVDLHRKHQEKLAPKADGWCLSCHAPHGSASPTAMVRLRGATAKDDGGRFEPSPTGGNCSGGCHAERKGTYTR